MAKNHTPQVLDIDLKGYRQSLQPKGTPRIMIEALSNAFDPKGTTVVVASLEREGIGYVNLTVRDNDPDGFKNLKDSYTLFAASERREDPEARGRFGQGEKEIVAICCETSQCYLVIRSTTGQVTFNDQGRTLDRAGKTTAGTELHAHFRMKKDEVEAFTALVRNIIPPEGVTFSFNGEVIERDTPVRTARETLDTVIWDAEGNMKDTRRVTNVEMFEAGDTAYIYELGIPVVEHDGRFHINVGQKVPLNATRDNVKPAYLRKLRQIMLDSTFDMLTQEDHKSTWVKDVVAIASDQAFDAVMIGTYGENAVIRDPNNPEATKRAVDQGRQIVEGRSLKKDVWSRMRERQTFKPAGQVIQTHIQTSPDGIPPIPREQWTEAMHTVAQYVMEMGYHALGFKPEVAFAPTNCGTGGKRFQASWGDSGTVTFYLRHLGKNWPSTVTQEALDAILIHEFTHHTADDHFTDRFIHDIAGIGARLRSCPTQLDQCGGR